jgi:oligopeptide/dipeptide ABC transporter ATP-binding protein
MTVSEPGTAATAPVAGPPLLEVTDLVKHFPLRGGTFLRRRVGAVHAVSGVSFSIAPGETLGLVGESGCGKSTTGRSVLQLTRPTSGSVKFDGTELTELGTAELRKVRRDMQVVFQDPFASLDPRLAVGAAIAEPLHIHGIRDKTAVRQRVGEMPCSWWGSSPTTPTATPTSSPAASASASASPGPWSSSPSCWSSTSRSPPSTCRSRPASSTCSTTCRRSSASPSSSSPTTSRSSGTSPTGSPSCTWARSSRSGTGPNVYERPAHPYTQALLSAVPIPDPKAERARKHIVLEGDVPSPQSPPSGCRFRTRCWKAQEICATEEPALVDRGQGHPVACHFAEVAAVV